MTPDSPLVSRVTPSPNFGDRRGAAVDMVILHYTGMANGEDARDRLCSAAAGVSCHYLVWPDGLIEQLVPEADRAWHAGLSTWLGDYDINARSIGIEIINAGHVGGCPPYPDAQVEAVISLCGDVIARHAIPVSRILGHSDIAPSRKQDPGEYFPWQRLADAGIGIWPPSDGESARQTERDARDETAAAQEGLAGIGYACLPSGLLDEETRTVVCAFQRHWRPTRVDGIPDAETCERIGQVLAAMQASGRLKTRTLARPETLGCSQG